MPEQFSFSPITAGMTLTERVYVTIKEAILELRIPPGSPLVEDELARQLGTSKTPVRDALVALERDGLVTKIPYKGTYVSEISLRDASEIFELRAVLEGLAARRAVRVITAELLSQLEGLLDAADEALARGDDDAASALGAEFHHLIDSQADNSHLHPILEKLEEKLRRLRRVSDQVGGRLTKSSHQHRRILAALQMGDPAQVEQAMRDHLESVVADFAAAAAAEAAETAAAAQPQPFPLPQPQKESIP